MDKSAIKNFAVGARVRLKEQIEQKAYAFGITKAGIKKVEMFEDAFQVNGNKYNKRLLKYRDSLEKKINEKGFEQVIEEVAYTWFNRLIAIRFMEVNEYLPTGVRVLSSTDSSKIEPDIIREATDLDFENLNIDLIYRLQDENNTEELFKYLLIKQCNELGKIMPVVFEEIEDFTELLLPDNLLQEGSIIRDLVTSITEEDWKEQVEIIGWLYQYYISEKKDEVFADLKKNVKITKENIPAATQLFTPDWIVKYMVENSLGRLWIESHPNDELKVKWKYYLEEAEQEADVKKQLEEIRENNRDLKPEDIKFLDPCMGSGHILVYAFDVLFSIYKNAGYSEREIPKLILENNLYGLDIDDRAAQLAYFAVIMKARSYNRRIFSTRIELNICSIQESNEFPMEAIDFLVNSKETELEKRLHRDDVAYLINVFNDAKEYGSILEVKEIDFEAIEIRVEEIKSGDSTNIFELQYKNVILEKIFPLIKQAKVLSRKYQVVCTNPPYMGNKGMNEKLTRYISKKYEKSKNDLYSVLIERCIELTNKNEFTAIITMDSWMFKSKYKDFRLKMMKNNSISTFIHLGTRAFEEISGEIVQTATFVLRNCGLIDKSIFIKLVKYKARNEKENEFFNRDNFYTQSKKTFEVLPDYPIAYWVSEQLLNIYKSADLLDEVAKPRSGITTGNNEKYVRFWFEIRFINKEFGDWVPLNSGGEFRRWYGNNLNVIYWKDGGNVIKNDKGSTIANMEFQFRQGLTWGKISNGLFGVRFSEEGYIFSAVGLKAFPQPKHIYYICGFLNSILVDYILPIFSSGLSILSGDIAKLPIIFPQNEELTENISEIVKQNILISKSDWDMFEISWNYSKNPILIFKHDYEYIYQAFNEWSRYSENQFDILKANEEKLNNIFINLYKLDKELIGEVNERNLTIRKADRKRDIQLYISYVIGCMVGRYSLDAEGLIYSGGQFNPDRYKIFKVNVDNVIPITDDEYFENDIVSRFVEFVRITFSEETLEENLDYIADTLGKKGNETSRQTIRRYLLKDFYKDHLKIYQKRPIYWLFDSGKNDGFKALIYMHRYDTYTVARVRTDYLHLLQRKYEAEINRLDMVMENSNESVREKTEAKKKKEKIQKQILECVQYDQVIAHVANQKISIDLDDGVSVNYDKFQGVEVPQGEGKKLLKADLLAKI